MGLDSTVLITDTFHGSRSTHELEYPTSKIDKSDLPKQTEHFVRHAITIATTPDYCNTLCDLWNLKQYEGLHPVVRLVKPQ